MAAKKMTAEKILREAQQKHAEIKDPTKQFRTQNGFENASLDEREGARRKLMDRYLDIVQEINSLFKTDEATSRILKWFKLWRREGTKNVLDHTEKLPPSGNTLESFEDVQSDINEWEAVLLTVQVAQENGPDCRGELSYRLAQLRAVQEGKNPDEIERTGDVTLNPSDDIVLAKVQDIIKIEDKTIKANKGAEKNISDTKNVK